MRRLVADLMWRGMERRVVKGFQARMVITLIRKILSLLTLGVLISTFNVSR